MGTDNKNRNTSFAPVPSYEKQRKWDKFKRKLNSYIVRKIHDTPLQFGLYRSYWHYKLSRKNSRRKSKAIHDNHFLTQTPNYGAGIGHQLANWNSGLHFSRFYKVRFAHTPFSTGKWENFLGFGEGEVSAIDLREDKRFKKIKLPKFNSLNVFEVGLIGKIISSYKRNNLLFTLETDQGYMQQSGTHRILSSKFFNADARKSDALTFSPDKFNIAIHIRRRMKIETDEVWKERGLDNSYFANILSSVLSLVKEADNIEIYLFSQGSVIDFPEFNDFEHMHYCMDMGPVESVLHMVNADLLISSKSSFSYKPALISKEIQICPKSFWHNYPSAANYIMADNDGSFDLSLLADQLGASKKLSGINNTNQLI